MKTPKIKQLVAGKCNGCDCRSKEPQCPKCLQFGFGGAAMISQLADEARRKRSVQRMARHTKLSPEYHEKLRAACAEARKRVSKYTPQQRRVLEDRARELMGSMPSWEHSNTPTQRA